MKRARTKHGSNDSWKWEETKKKKEQGKTGGNAGRESKKSEWCEWKWGKEKERVRCCLESEWEQGTESE